MIVFNHPCYSNNSEPVRIPTSSAEPNKPITVKEPADTCEEKTKYFERFFWLWDVGWNDQVPGDKRVSNIVKPMSCICIYEMIHILNCRSTNEYE